MGTLNQIYPPAFRVWKDQVAKKWEGELSDRDKKADPGGLTNKGITWVKYLEYAPSVLGTNSKERFFALSDDDVDKIAYQKYWLTNRIDSIKDDKIKVVAMDSVFNGGGIHSLGYPSIDALNKANPTAQQVIANRLAWYKSLKNWPQNKNGWTNRLVDMQTKLTGLSKIASENSGVVVIFFILVATFTFLKIKNYI